jgi:hypothetical protein
MQIQTISARIRLITIFARDFHNSKRRKNLTFRWVQNIKRIPYIEIRISVLLQNAEA